MTVNEASQSTFSANLKYNAFISYAWDHPDHVRKVNDSAIARRLRNGLLALATPRLRKSDLHVFVDRIVQVSSPDLWREILSGLEQSSYLIVLCSSLSAQSKGVEREVRHWLSLNRGLNTILVVLLEGSLDDSLPLPLREERAKNGYDPYFVDLRWVDDVSELDIKRNARFQEDVATLAAAVRGVPKEDLVSDELAIQRRTRQIQTGFIVGLSVALVLAVLLGVVAWYQRDQARRETDIAEARALAAQSQSLLTSRLDIAQLLAVQAYRRDPNPQTTAALFTAVSASPELDRYLNVDSKVGALATSQDGKILVAGTDSGRLYRWQVESVNQDVAALFPAPISSVAVNNDATIVAATDGTGIATWGATGVVQRMKIPNLGRIQAVGLSPSGRILAVADGPVLDHPMLSIVDIETGRVTRAQLAIYGASKLIMNDEATVLAGDSTYGTWQRIDLKTMAPVPPLNSSALTGAHDYADVFSENGAFYSWTNAASTIPVFTTDSAAPDNDSPDLVADGPGHDPNALALSPDGKLIAIADSGAITVEPTRLRTATLPEGSRQTFLGAGTVNPNGLAFLGTGKYLASASGNSVILWNRQRIGRIGASTKLLVPGSCNACGGPTLTLSDNGKKLAVIDGNNSSVTVTSVPRVGVTSAETIQYVSTAPGSPLGVGFGPAGWSADSNTLFVGIGGSGQVALRTDGPNGPSIRTADIDKSAVQVRLGTVAGVGTQTVLVRSNTLLPARAASLSHAASVLKSALRANGQEYSESWALSPDGARVATIVGSDLWLVAVQDGAITRVPVGEAGHVSFTSTKLCVARYQGPIDVRDPVSGTLLKTIPGDQADSGIIASGRDSNILARIRLDGLIELIDVEQGQLIGTVGKQGTIQYGMVPGLLITPGGSELFVVYPYSPEVAGSGEVQELKASPESWIRAACQSVGRNLTAAEWHASMGDVEPENLDCR